MSENINIGFFQETMLRVRSVLSKWLEARLSEINMNFWKELVLPKLSFQQRGMVAAQHFSCLDELDFLGLLRVFDKNWYEIDSSRPKVNELSESKPSDCL